jgi:hypothetical protein
MRRSLTVCRHGLCLAAAVVVLTACGGSDDGGDDQSSASSATSSSASGSSPGAANSEFCTRAAGAQDQLEAAIVQSQTDLASLPGSIQALEADVAAIEPPPEIASDWNAYAALIEQASTEISSIDFTDPNASATLQEKLTPVITQLGTLSTGVSDYLRDECGSGPLPSVPASPTS